MDEFIQQFYTQALDEFPQKALYKQTIFIFRDTRAKIQPLSLDYLEMCKHTEERLQKYEKKEIEHMV